MPAAIIGSTQALGKVVRESRRRAGLTQRQLAGRAQLGTRFVSDLERGKPTAEVGKVLQLLDTLGVKLAAEQPALRLADILAVMRRHQSELRHRGVLHAGIFGSTARGEERPESDVDVLLELDEERVRSLLDLAEIQIFLQEIIGRPVDIAERKRLRPHVAPSALADLVSAF